MSRFFLLPNFTQNVLGLRPSWIVLLMLGHIIPYLVTFDDMETGKFTNP